MLAEDLDLHALLSVDPDAGVVRFAGERALIVDAAAVGVLRRDLVDALGLPGAHTVLLRFGHAQGTRAAEAMQGRFAWDDPLALRDAGGASASCRACCAWPLQQREVRRVGENHARPIHARVIAATHRDLASAVAAGSFRRDLYYRLRVVELRVPPLRERSEDLLPLAESLLHAAAVRLRRDPRPLSPAAITVLRRHDWPGNVRELENAMERAAALATGPAIEPQDLPDDLSPATPAAPEPTTLQQLERAAILAALARHAGNQSAAAAELGISPSTLYRRLRSYDP